MSVYIHAAAGSNGLFGTVDHAFLHFSGKINYLDVKGNPQTKSFNFSDMWREKVAGLNGEDENGFYRLNNGDLFRIDSDCGDAHLPELTHCSGDAIVELNQEEKRLWYIGSTYCHQDDCTCNNLCDDGNHKLTMLYRFNIPNLTCNKLAQVVDSDGQSKAWAERINNNFSGIDCNDGMSGDYEFGITPDPISSGEVVRSRYSSTTFPLSCEYDTAFLPFGAASQPAGTFSFQSDPSFWHSALLYASLTDTQALTQGQMGQLQSKNLLSGIFAESRGVWNWDGDRYVPSLDENWHSPETKCDDNKRLSSGSNSNCAVAPTVANLKLNGNAEGVSTYLSGRGFVGLSFNSNIDGQQAPLIAYEVDWGDTEKFSVAGAGMPSKPNPDNPHLVYHAYDYYDLLSKYNNDDNSTKNLIPTLICGNDGTRQFCKVKPRVKLIDNWGWCTEGSTSNSCPASNSAGECMNSSGVHINGSVCVGNYIQDSNDRGRISDLTKYCSASSPFCADGWWEPGAYVIVYEPGT
jgi:hypothetical protein